jgi:hypothetical protein
MLLVDCPVGPNDGGLDVAECRIDPFEAGGASRGSARAGYDDLVGTSGLGHSPETGQAVADNRAGRIEAALGKHRNRVIAEAGNPPQPQLHRLALRRGLDGGAERRLAGGTAAALAAGALTAEVGSSSSTRPLSCLVASRSIIT